jgi:sulfopyruvate decarboxylase TPP-binding subunit
MALRSNLAQTRGPGNRNFAGRGLVALKPRPPLAIGRHVAHTRRKSMRHSRAPGRAQMTEATSVKDGADAVAQRIVDATAACGISLVASLPDGWITPLIARFAADTRFRHVAVNREESAIGLCSGAFLGGIGTLALMGASGFLTCIYAITKINYTYQIPLLIGITLRGRPGDGAKFHQSNGLYLEPVIAAIGLPFIAVEHRDDIARLPVAYRHSRVMSRPVVVGFSREVLRGDG